MKMLTKAALLAGAMMAAMPASAQIIDLSATNFGASQFTQLFAAGDYEVSLTQGTYTAWAPAFSPSNPDPDWVGYYRYTINGVSAFANTFNPKAPRFATPTDAFNAYSSGGPLKLSFAAPTSVTFAIADNQSSFGDNAGGLSLQVSAVPEPATWGMMMIGMFATGGALRSARRQRTTVAFAA